MQDTTVHASKMPKFCPTVEEKKKVQSDDKERREKKSRLTLVLRPKDDRPDTMRDVVKRHCVAVPEEDRLDFDWEDAYGDVYCE